MNGRKNRLSYREAEKGEEGGRRTLERIIRRLRVVGRVEASKTRVTRSVRSADSHEDLEVVLKLRRVLRHQEVSTCWVR